MIGSALAGHLILAGNRVVIGARRPEAFTPPDYRQEEDIDYRVRPIEEAIEEAEVAVLAIPNAAVASFADHYRDRLAGAEPSIESVDRRFGNYLTRGEE